MCLEEKIVNIMSTYAPSWVVVRSEEKIAFWEETDQEFKGTSRREIDYRWRSK